VDTLVHLLRESAQRYGDSPALSRQVGLRRATWSYRQLAETADGTAWHLRDRRLAPGTRVIVWEPNSPELVALFFGAMLARLVLVPIDPSATPEFVARVAADTDARLTVSSLPGAPSGSVPVADLVKTASTEPFPEGPLPDDTVEIVFTSGTTGSPKGVALTHRNIVGNVNGVLSMFPAHRLRLVSLLPLSHMLEQTVGLFGPLAMGSAIHYPATRRPSALLTAMRRTRVTTMVVVPQVLQLMFDRIEKASLARSRHRWRAAHRFAPYLPMLLRRIMFRAVHRRLGGHFAHVMCGGAALEANLAGGWERLGVRVIEGYGTTECAPVVSGHTYWDRCRDSVGKPLPGVAVSLSPDGEILVKGPNVFAGYWENREATAAAIDAAGWYHTGDLGSWDEHGHLRIAGRLSDRIVLPSGMNVYPEDVESELVRESAIADCVVVPVPDARGKTKLGVVIIAAPGLRGERPGLAEVEEAARTASGRLAPHQRPTTVSLWPGEDFPRTNLLKVKRYEVAAALATGVQSPPAAKGSAPSDRLREIVAELANIDAATLAGESDLTLDAGLDSLGMLQLAVALEEEFGVVVEDGELARLQTLDSLTRLVAEGGPGATEAEAEWREVVYVGALRSALQNLFLFPLHRLVARPFATRGLDNLEDLDGPCLFIANHCSHTDTPSILRALPARFRRRMAVAAAADYFYRTWLGGAAFTLVLGTFPFSRKGEVRSSFERCGRIADEGKSILIYPEGTRSTTGRMGSFQAGIGLLAKELGLPVIPVGLEGTFAVLPKGSRFPRSGGITVTFGTPIGVDPDDDPTEVVAILQRSVEALVEHPLLIPAGETAERRSG
jgi:long-chain acyl-CoA synthetase